MAVLAPRLTDLLVASGIAGPDEPVVQTVQEVLDRAERAGPLMRLPAPLPPSDPFPEGRLSPRLLTLLAKALDAREGHRVLLVGDPLVALAGVLLELPERPDEVVLVSDNPSRARWTLHRLRLEGAPGLTVTSHTDGIPRGPFARILAFDQVVTHDLRERLDDDSVLLEARIAGPHSSLVQHVRIDGTDAHIDLAKHWISPKTERSRRKRHGRTPEGATMGRLLHVERMQQNAWRGIAANTTEQSVLRAVRETFIGGGTEDEEVLLPDDAELRLARRIFHLAYLEQVAGTRQNAAALYRASLEVHQTAESWTFYGWVRSQDGSLQEAMDSCRRAIDIDPAFGNPYNDIGAYLMAEGKTDDAKNWFERATQAPRYSAPHYPYTNLGRVYLREGDLHSARHAVEQALDMMPGYPPAERLLREIEAREAHDPSAR